MAASPIQTEDAVVTIEDGVDLLDSPSSFLCGRLLSSKSISVSSLLTGLNGIWRLKKKMAVHEEEDGIFVFHFMDPKERNRILQGGPWFFNNSTLLLAAYDGVSDLKKVSLDFLEVWVSVKGLRVGMRNEEVLTRIGNLLGSYIHPDQTALHRRDVVQKIRLVHDVRRRILERRTFFFSSELSVELKFIYEKYKGVCKACGLFVHGAIGCDKALEATPSAVMCMEDEHLGPVAAVEQAVGLDSSAVMVCQAQAAAGKVGDCPIFSAGNLIPKLGLTSGAELTRSQRLGLDVLTGPQCGLEGLQACVDGSAVTELSLRNPSVLGVRKLKALDILEVHSSPKKFKFGNQVGWEEETLMSLMKKAGWSIGRINKVSKPKKSGPLPLRVTSRVATDKGKAVA